MSNIIISHPKVRVIKNPTTEEKIEKMIDQLGQMTAALLYQFTEKSRHD